MTTARKASRRILRQGLTDTQRIELLEDDMDEREAEHAAADLADIKFQEETDKRLARTQQILMGILISLVTASILLAMNIAIQGVAT